MDKKDYLIKILEQLEPIWNLAKWLKILVEMWHLDENLLDVVAQAIQWAIHTVKDNVSKKKLRKSLNYLEKLKQMENNSKIQDEKDLVKLDEMIANM